MECVIRVSEEVGTDGTRYKRVVPVGIENMEVAMASQVISLNLPKKFSKPSLHRVRCAPMSRTVSNVLARACALPACALLRMRLDPTSDASAVEQGTGANRYRLRAFGAMSAADWIVYCTATSISLETHRQHCRLA